MVGGILQTGELPPRLVFVVLCFFRVSVDSSNLYHWCGRSVRPFF